MKRMLFVCLFAALIMVLSTPVMAASGTVHIVQPGQTLEGIARWYGVDMWSLARANGLANPNYIYVGQRLTIPASTPIVPTGTYVVQPGDTLYSIARRYGVTVWAIAQANGIYNLSWIYVGQTLVIPGYQPAPPVPKPAPQPVVAAWRGEYYASKTPSGGPAFVRNDAAINFRWGTGAPDPRLPVDAFSVHWTRSIQFKGGLYRFSVVTDDGVRVWIDGRLIIDGWKIQPETTYTADVILDPGSHLVAVDYYDDQGIATVNFSFVRLGSAPPIIVTPSPVPSPTSVATPGAPTNAWLGEYFGNPDVAGAPAVTRHDADIGFDWGLNAPVGGVPSDYFSVRWRRTASFYGDNYGFCAMADDGVRIYVDGQLILGEWHGSHAVTYCSEAAMTAGMHEITVEYYDAGGGALIYVWWERH